MDRNTIVKVGVLIGAAVIMFGVIRTLGTPPAPEALPVPEVEVVEVKYKKVLVAATDLSLGSRLGEENLEWKKWPEEAVTDVLITKSKQSDAIEEFSNAIVRSGIVEGEPINPSKLVTSGSAGVMAALLNPGMRAVTTRISPDTAAGGFIQPGDRVDVILTRTFEVQAGQAQEGDIIDDKLIVAQTIFKNVRVLAIDQTFSTGPEGGADIIGSTATFELNPADVEMLQEAEAAGDLSLTLRGLSNANAYTRSSSDFARSGKPEQSSSSTLTLYRSGQAQRVAIEGPK